MSQSLYQGVIRGEVFAPELDEALTHLDKGRGGRWTVLAEILAGPHDVTVSDDEIFIAGCNGPWIQIRRTEKGSATIEIGEPAA